MTTPTARCPRCNSTFYSPDPSNGGAGRNKCLDCGTASPVAEWYPPPVHGEIRMTSRVSPDGEATIYKATLYVDPRKLHRNVTDTPAPMHKPAPIRQYKDD